jgi:hypothetical protein
MIEAVSHLHQSVTEVVMLVVMKSVFSASFSIMCMLNTDYTRHGIYSVSYACGPKMKTILRHVRRFYRFHSRFKENMLKDYAEIKLGKIGAHLEASARKSLVHFARQMAISASIA